MVGALILVSLRQWQNHKLRLALTLLGVSIGIGAFFAVITANLTLTDSLQNTVEKLAGKSTLQITAGETGFSEEYLETIRSDPNIKIAEPVIETIAKTSKNENILIIGLDTASDLELHSQIVAEQDVSISNPMAFINKPDSIAVSRSFADRNGVKENDVLEVFVSEEKKKFVVRGFFKPSGAADIFGGNIAVLDVYAARDVFGRGKVFDRIDIMTRPGVPVEEVQTSLREKLPEGIRIERPSSRGKGLENSVSSISFGMSLMSFLALTIGVFIIFNCFYINVNQRWKEIGVLRALGVESGQITLMFLGEAVILGLFGSLLGIASGYFLAIGATEVMSTVTQSTYGLVTSTSLPTLRLDYILYALLTGIVSSLFAALVPAREAARLDPIAALRNIEARKSEKLSGNLRFFIGLIFVLIALSLTSFVDPDINIAIQLSYWFFLMIGMVMMLPKFIRLGAFILRPLMSRLFGIEGVIAVDSMSRAPRRTTATVGALMVGLSFVYSNGTIIQSQKAALTRNLGRAASADIFVTTSDQVRSRVYHFSEETSEKVRALDGVSSIGNLRITTLNYRGDDVAVLAHDMDRWITQNPDMLDQGNAVSVKKEMENGEGFFVSQNFSYRFGVKLGDTLTLKSPGGNISRKVLGILDYYQSEFGTVFLERNLFKKYWNDDALDYILIDLKPGTDRAKFKAALEKTIAGEQKAFIYSEEEYRDWVMKLIDQFFTLNYLQMVIAIFVAGLGLINTMVISVAERKREIGVIRAIGGLRQQIRKMILLESVCISAVGICTGILAGSINAYCAIRISIVAIAGFTLPLRFPFFLIALSIPVVLLVALFSAWVPAKQASDLEVAEAIDYE
ncbi:MAG: FtsX-like permease family protein [Pyrinomonadaceae bacterium]